MAGDGKKKKKTTTSSAPTEKKKKTEEDVIREQSNTEGLKLPPKIGYEDMTKMENMTLDGVLDNLKERYENDLIYTYTSSILVAINPYQRLPIYGKQWVKYYKGKRLGLLAPHVYAVAETTYTNMLQHGKNQSVLVSGESGAGKTETTKLMMQYLSDRTDRESEMDKKVLASFPVLEALGNAKTLRNDNSSRFGKFIEIQFDDENYITGSRIIPYLLEKSRIVRQTKGERNYHIFYNLTVGMKKEDRVKFHLDDWDKFDYLNTTGVHTVPDVDEHEEFKVFTDALSLFQVTQEMQEMVFKIIAAVLHCGNVAYKADGDKSAFKDARSEKAVETVAELLSLDAEKLKWALRYKKIKTMREVIDKPLDATTAKDNTDAFAKHIYATLFEWTVQQLNACTIAEKYKSFIGVLDIFGFEVFELNSFEQFLINYTNEKLQQFFNHQIFKLEQAIYEQEKIDWSVIEFKDNQECLDLIEKRRPPGLLAILDEETKFPRATDDSLIEKLHNNFDKKHAYYDKPRLTRKTFGVKHFAGTVMYNVTQWRDKNRDEISEVLNQELQASTNPFIAILYTGEGADGGAAPVLKNDSLGVDDSKAKQRLSFSPGGNTGKAVERKEKGRETLGAQFKGQLNDLMTMLGATEPFFVRCIKPNQHKRPNDLDQELTYNQLLYAGMLETIRIRRMGYPIRYSHEDFFKRFRCIAPEVAPMSDLKQAAFNLAKGCGVNMPMQCQIGTTLVFLKQETANDLEDRRLVALTSVIIKMQTWWRYVNAHATFTEMRQNAVLIQSWYRYAHQRGLLRRKRKSARLLQDYYRMVLAMRKRKALAEKKRKAEEARRKKEEEERKKRIAKYGEEKVRQEEEEKQKKEAEKMRRLASGVSIGEVVEEKPKEKPKLGRSISIKMEKMQELEVPINVDGKIVLGLGWKKSQWELDVSILLFRYTTHREDVYFFKPRSRDSAVIHKAGWEGRKGYSRFGDREQIEINLVKMSAKTNTVIIVATVFDSKGNFSSVQDAYVRLFDHSTEHEYCHYPLEQSKSKSETAKIVCKLFRQGFTRWRIKAIGEGTEGRVYKHMIPKVQPFLDEEPSKRKLKVTVHEGKFEIHYPEDKKPGRRNKGSFQTFCYVRFDNREEKTKYIKEASVPGDGDSLRPSYNTSKSISGHSTALEITVMHAKKLGSESLLGRAIIDWAPDPNNKKKKTSPSRSEEWIDLEEIDAEWARGVTYIKGQVKITIDEA